MGRASEDKLKGCGSIDFRLQITVVTYGDLKGSSSSVRR